MSRYQVRLSWKRETEDFSYDSYSREHTVEFEGGTKVRASAAPDYQGDATCVNPEEAFAASLASCHMLTFLAIAARKRFVVDSYEDEAVAVMEKNDQGKMAVTQVILRPRIVFSGDPQPNAGQLEQLHESAHSNCFIANSVRTDVVIESRP